MDIKNGCGDTGGEQEDADLGGKPDLYTTMCKIGRAGGKLLLAQGAQLGAPR